MHGVVHSACLADIDVTVLFRNGAAAEYVAGLRAEWTIRCSAELFFKKKGKMQAEVLQWCD